MDMQKNNNEDWRTRARRILNTVFLVLGAAGVVQYFLAPEDRTNALIIIGIALCIKIVEILIRILG